MGLSIEELPSQNDIYIPKDETLAPIVDKFGSILLTKKIFEPAEAKIVPKALEILVEARNKQIKAGDGDEPSSLLFACLMWSWKLPLLYCSPTELATEHFCGAISASK